MFDQTLATLDEIEWSGGVTSCFITSLRLKICIIYGRSDIMLFFDNMYSLHDDDDFGPLPSKVLGEYRGVAFPQACGCEPLLIPSDSQIETHHLEAIQQRPTFLIAIWKSDGTSITALPRF